MINYSRQRNTVLSVLRSTDTHPTVDWVYAECRKIIPNISLGTVYRNLNMLVEIGDPIRIKGAFEKDRFDGCVKRHAHMICDRCGAVIDVPVSDGVDEELRTFIKGNDFGIEDYDVTFCGVCKNCSDK